MWRYKMIYRKDANFPYPVVMSPMLEKEDLEKVFFEYLGYYYDVSNLKA